MKDLKRCIIEFSKDKLKVLAEFSEKDFSIVKVGDIDCDQLPTNGFDNDIREMPTYKKIFTDLDKIRTPVVYYFKILTDYNATEIKEAIANYKKSVEKKEKIKMSIPPINSGVTDSKILYVGKRLKGGTKKNSHISGRLIPHLGFYTKEDENKVRVYVSGTSGLQLFHWAKGTGLKVSLNIIIFPNELNELLGAFENHVAQALKPILGSHRN